MIFHTVYHVMKPLLQPVVFLHGGPGGGTTPSNRRFFDPDFYRIILFDQVNILASHHQAEVYAASYL